MANICTTPGCYSYGRYCRRHPGGSLKEPKAIAKESKTRQEVNKDYLPAAKQYIKDNPLCKIKSPVCIKKSQHVHHMRGRVGELLTDKKYWMPACDKCNSFIEQNDGWARANGFKLSKHSPIKRAA
ncbi:MAG: hypothetical protein V4615_05115 [Bacteroidota bacterium]